MSALGHKRTSSHSFDYPVAIERGFDDAASGIDGAAIRFGKTAEGVEDHNVWQS
jgi:hypothetical protein